MFTNRGIVLSASTLMTLYQGSTTIGTRALEEYYGSLEPSKVCATDSIYALGGRRLAWGVAGPWFPCGTMTEPAHLPSKFLT